MPAPAATAPTGPEVAEVLTGHARRGVRLQVAVRAVLVVFVAVTVLTVPPAQDVALCAVTAVVYALAAVAVALWVRFGGPAAVRWAWTALFGDLAVIAALTLLTGATSPQSWTSDVLAAGFLLVPVLAAAQLRPRVCTAVVVPTVLAFLAAAVATRAANGDEPWASLLLRTLVVAGVGAACIGLSRIQRSRVETIGRLVRTRTDLLAELAELERRERRELSEQLHDGALQYVLAARQDLDDARDTGSPEAFDRVEEALVESSRLLRSTVAELHPAVLERAGLPAALRDLTRTAAARGGFAVDLDADAWPDRRTPVDALVYRTARELLGNAVRHARAARVTVRLALDGPCARLTVADDGVGVTGTEVGMRLAEGHIGLASHTLRLEAAGGRLTVVPGAGGGTVATAEVPVRPS